MAEQLNVQIRETHGTRNAKRQRSEGATPAVLYGHGKETLSLSVAADALEAAIRHGSRVVSLAGAVTEKAIIRELQWDTWGAHVLHVDFARVFEHEMVEVTVPVELRGEAPGIKEGGQVEQMIHEVNLRCEATLIPDKLLANINNLELHGEILLSDLEVPERSELLDPAETVVVQCVLPIVEEEEEEAEEGAEPEVIGRKEEEEEEEQG
jgi:large subunit ribosomal protein L25